MSIAEAEALLRDAGWTEAMDYDGQTPVVLVAKQGHLYAITGVDPNGENRAGARNDAIQLALDLIAMCKPKAQAEAAAEIEPEPEPEPLPPPEPSISVSEHDAIVDSLHDDAEAKLADLEAKLAEAEAKLATADARNAESEKRIADAQRAVDEAHEALAAKVVIQEPERRRDDLLDFDTDEPVDDIPDLSSDDLITLAQHNEPAAQLVVTEMSNKNRSKFTELLYVELAELEQVHGVSGENLPREAGIQKLLGLFARVGERT